MGWKQWRNDELARLRSSSPEPPLTGYPEAGGKVRVESKTWLNFSSDDYLETPCLGAAMQCFV